MKTFIVPALYVIEAEDAEAALRVAAEIQECARCADCIHPHNVSCFLDEKLPITEITVAPDEDRPWTIVGYVPIPKSQTHPTNPQHRS